ncbi:MAG: RNA polymerase sigma-70 factor ECF subfamily [Anaerolineaceae bacterium]|nr:MAG: RNA polymerase sigma-70 factor ECF subfamily [Anaerolineaceae bacterium]
MPASRNAEAELALIEQAQNGDRSAYEELVRRYYTRVVHIVHRMCGDMTLAEDAAQEAFLRAWVHLSSFHPDSSLRNWLYRIAVNAALDVLRRKTEEPVEDEKMQWIPDQAPGPEAALIQKEQAAFLQQAMKSLPEASRSVLVLREYGELSYEEIATVLDIPMGTVMSRLNYARNRLRETLKAQLLQMEQAYA